MIQNIVSLLSPFLPAILAEKGLSKLDPRLGKFFTGAAAAGYGVDQALGFLRNQFQTPSNIQERERLQGPNLRPDERAAGQMIRQSDAPVRLLGGLAKGAGALAGGLAGLGAGSNAENASKQPQGPLQGVSEAIDQAKQRSETYRKMGAYPEDLAQQAGAQQTQTTSPPKQQTGGVASFIAQNPDLGNYLDALIQNGTPPREAAVSAKGKKQFRNSIADIESNIGQLFEELIEGLFKGTPQATQPKDQGKQQQLVQLLDQLKKIRGKR